MANVSRKAYLMVLGLAGAAYVADQALSGGPAAALAGTFADSLTVPASERKPVLPVVNTSDTAAGRLAGFASGEANPRGDLGIVPAWLVVKAELPAPKNAENAKPWTQRHRVSGYSSGQSQGISIDGDFIKVGEIVDGMMLTSIALDSGEAVFVSATGVEARLALPGLRRDAVSENRATDTSDTK